MESIDARVVRLRRDTERTPADPIVWTHLGRVLVEAQRWDEAAKAFAEALRHNPDPDDKHSAHFGMGKASRFLGRPLDAVKHLEEAARLKPEDPPTRVLLGVAYMEANLPGDSERALIEAVRLNPNLADAHSSLGMLTFGQQRYEEAVKWCEQAQLLDANDIGCRVMMAMALLKLNRIADAVKPLKEAVRIEPDNPQWWYYLGLGCFDTQDFEGGAEARRTLERLDPSKVAELDKAEQMARTMKAVVDGGGIVIRGTGNEH